MALNVYLSAGPSGEVDTIKKEGGLHSRKIWRLPDAKKKKKPKKLYLHSAWCFILFVQLALINKVLVF